MLVRTLASLHSASLLTHHATVRQGYPNQDHYPDSEPDSRSLAVMCRALNRAEEPKILMSFV